MVNQTTPSAACCALNMSGMAASIRSRGNSFRVIVAEPVAVRTADAARLAPAEKHMIPR
jgi:hypothetical protein